MMKQINLPHGVIVKANGLLPMKYKPVELAEELGIPKRTLVDWLKRGIPHLHDEQNHIWINGDEFLAWVRQNQSHKAVHRKLKENEGYCFRCKKVVIMESQEVTIVKGNLIHIGGSCPECKGRVSRGGRRNGQSR
jgi:hypothetical protein